MRDEDCGQKGITTMKQRVLKTISCCVAALALGAGGYALAGTTSLSLTFAGPQPDTVTVPWGDTLEITNEDTVPHSLVSSHPELQSGLIAPGQTFTTTFTTRAHTYGYRQIGGRGFPGHVVVAFSGRVSLRVSRSSVPFGRSVILRGVTSIESTPVAIQVRRGGDVRWRAFREVFSNGRGAFSTAVRFERGARLRATVAAGQIRSAATTVTVTPKLTVSARRGGVRAKLFPARAASKLTLECSVAPGRWKRVAAKRLGPSGVVSFRLHAGRGALVRVATVHRDVVDGYAARTSRALRLSAAC
jgi:plastocyanin